MKACSRVDLMLPERAGLSAGSFVLSKKNIQAWLDDLPMGHRGEAARRLFELLEQVNRCQYGVVERMRFLERIRQPVRELTGALRKHYYGMAFPLPARGRGVSEVVRGFYEEMAVGYMEVVQDLDGSSIFAACLNRSMLRTALHRAMVYLSRVLLSAYEIYAPHPDGVWLRLHSLYRCALSHRVDLKLVWDEENVYNKKTTPGDVYKQISLLALASPYRLRQGDVGKIYAALELWVSECRLETFDESQGAAGGAFLIRYEEDAPPAFSGAGEDTEGSSGWRLDTEPLSDHLRRRIDRMWEQAAEQPPASAEEPIPDISRDMLNRLMLTWGMVLDRESERHASSEDLELILGMAAIHHFLAQQETAPVSESSGTETFGTTSFAVAPGRGRPNTQFNVHRCEALDECEGGYRFFCTEHHAKLQVGALLAWRRGGGDPWKPAVVRWMRMSEGDALQFGVQCLGSRMVRTSVRSLSADRQRGEPVQAILIPPDGPPSARPTVAISEFGRDFPSKVELTLNGQIHRVRLIRMIENTGSFGQFHFVDLAEAEEKTSTPGRPSASFAKLWKSL